MRHGTIIRRATFTRCEGCGAPFRREVEVMWDAASEMRPPQFCPICTIERDDIIMSVSPTHHVETAATTAKTVAQRLNAAATESES